MSTGSDCPPPASTSANERGKISPPCCIPPWHTSLKPGGSPAPCTCLQAFSWHFGFIASAFPTRRVLVGSSLSVPFSPVFIVKAGRQVQIPGWIHVKHNRRRGLAGAGYHGRVRHTIIENNISVHRGLAAHFGAYYHTASEYSTVGRGTCRDGVLTWSF